MQSLPWAPAASFSLSLALACYGSVKWIKPLLRGVEPEQMIRAMLAIKAESHYADYVCMCVLVCGCEWACVFTAVLAIKAESYYADYVCMCVLVCVCMCACVFTAILAIKAESHYADYVCMCVLVCGRECACVCTLFKKLIHWLLNDWVELKCTKHWHMLVYTAAQLLWCSTR